MPSAYYPAKGGTELRVQKVSEILSQQGHEVTVLTSDLASVGAYFNLGAKKVEPKKETLNSVKVVRVSFGKFFYKLASFLYKYAPLGRLRNRLKNSALAICEWIFARGIKTHINNIKPDVVMITPHLHPNVIATINAHEERKFPLVFVPCLHEQDPHWPFEKMKEALSKVDIVLAMTDYEAHLLSTKYSVKKEDIMIGSLGVDIPTSYKKTDTSCKEVTFLGRKVPSKGIPLLIEAMKLVWKSSPEVKLTLAGSRDIETQKIDELLNSLPIEYSKRIRSLDNISDKDRVSVLESSLCLVLPSKIESFGGVILEAWAYSTPAITFDLPVFKSFVSSDKDTLLVPPDNPKALAEAILKIIDNSELAKSLGDAGRKKVEDKFTWDKIASNYLRAYERAVAKCGS